MWLEWNKLGETEREDEVGGGRRGKIVSFVSLSYAVNYLPSPLLIEYYIGKG